MSVPEVKGIRKCNYCQGICHLGSYRTNYKKRNKYFCSYKCLDGYDMFDTLRQFDMIERVDVITK